MRNPASTVERAFGGLFGDGRELGNRTVDVGRVLSCALVLQRVVRCLVHDFADVCWVDVVTDVGLTRAACAANDPTLERTLDDVAPTSIASGSGFRWRTPTSTSPIAPVEAQVDRPQLDHVDVLRALQAQTFLREPLIEEDDVIGALTVASMRSDVRFGQREQRTVEAVARGLAFLLAKDAAPPAG